MSIFGNFTEALDDLITSERQAEFAPLVAQKLYERLRIDDYGIVIDGVRHGDASVSLVQSPVYNSIPFVSGDSCEITTCDFDVDYEGKVWDLVMAECRYDLCTRTASRKFMALYGQYKAIHPEDSEYDFIVSQMMDILTDILYNSLIAKLFLSDEAYTEDTINGTNGFISQWLLEANNTLNVDSLVTDANDVTGEEWIAILNAMKDKYEDMPFRKTIADAQFVIDEVAARRITSFLNQKDKKSIYDCDCVTADGIVQADRFTVEGLRVSGILVKTIPYTDMVAQFDELMVDGEAVNPIFAVLTPKTEVQVGTPNQRELEMNDSFYDRKDRTYYFDVGYQVGAMIPSNNFILATSTPNS